MRRFLVALALVAGCDDTVVVQDGLTGVEVTVEYPTDRGIDQLRLWGTIDGALTFSPGLLPEQRRLLTAGSDSIVILLDPSLADRDLFVRADGLAAGVVVGSGAARVTVRADKLSAGSVRLGPAAVCGDGVVTAGVEECDDGNATARDGCADLCNAEPGFTCSGQPSLCLAGFACGDGVDNDRDGLTDLDDPGCANGGDNSEHGASVCDDGVDNDDDGASDFRTDGTGDNGCLSPTGTTELNGGPCNDGADNDGDGLSDFRASSIGDPGCTGVMDLSERGAAACDDGTDNDGDETADYPDRKSVV